MHKEATQKGKLYFYSIMLVILLFALFIKYLESLFPLKGDEIEQLLQRDNRNFYLAIINTIIILAFIYLATFIAKSTKAYMQFPPPNIEIPFRQKITVIKNAQNIWLIYGIFITSFFLQLILGFVTWYNSHKLISEVITLAK